MDVKIYHNPRCSKSRVTLALLQERGLDIHIIEYLKEPPSRDDIARLIDLLGVGVGDIIRKNEQPYKDLMAQNIHLDDDALLNALQDHPILLQRPIVVVDNNRAAIGRPPEAILDLLC